MGVAREYPIRFTPRGLSDAYDATDTFSGACRSLQNLVFDQSNPELVTARPGVGDPTVSFVSQNSNWGAGKVWGTPGLVWGSVTFIAPTVITVHIALGSTIYGMVSSGLHAGYDEPFSYTVGVGFTTMTGVTSGNVPSSPTTSGDWTPPMMAVIGSKIIVTHSGFSGSGSNFFGVIDISNPLVPVWSAHNTSTNLLPGIPTGVINFNNRAYFSYKNILYYSDVLAPTVMTGATQFLTISDTSPITGMSGLPVSTTSAGVVGALIIFKAFQIWQITGDAAVSGTLSLNFLSLNIGCLGPRTIVQTPVGTVFIGIDGPYVVSPLGAVNPLTKDAQRITQDIQQPFQNIVSPSRAAASFSGPIYRVCIDTVISGQAQTYDYWFDITRRRWTGPHTFPYDCASQVGNYFIISSRLQGANLFTSPYVANASATYLDNGNPFTVVLESSSFPKTENINEKQVVESTFELSSVATNVTYQVNAFDEQRTLIGFASFAVNNPPNTWGGGLLWGGGATWQNTNSIPKTYTVPWTAPVVFKKIAIQVLAQSTSNLSIGTFFAKYQDTGYINR